ncbi:MAG: glycosyl hydrolase-related protein [Ilumatobacteraceae bacterium]
MSHTHWDREWYESAEWFSGRLVTTVDRVLELLEGDPGWAFVLDGQAIVVEDYLDSRPDRAEDVRRFVAAGRLAIGPWYVQPDSLLPSGEAHVRNLLEGRHVCDAAGGTSRVAYTPDSFGHPGWFPSLFRGFDLAAFVYWRGHGSERNKLPARWIWRASDHSEILAWHLEGSYLAAASLEPDPEAAADRLHQLCSALAVRSPNNVLVMNGVDHSVPDPHTEAVATELGQRTGWAVRRSTLDDAVADVPRPESVWEGSLTGARDANLLPGVWSSRMPLKLANRHVEAGLWRAERMAAMALLSRLPDERPTLRRIRRLMLQNQAHDSIGGCSIDEVHTTMAVRSSTAIGAAHSLTHRLCESMSGLGPEHLAPWADGWDVAVWNPSAFSRREIVRIPIEGWPAFRVRHHGVERHPGHVATLDGRGFEVNGTPARMTVAIDQHRDRFSPEQELVDLEVDVELPPLGWTRLHLTRAERVDDEVDQGRTLEAAGVRVEVAEDGTLLYAVDGLTRRGLLGIVDRGDRGDTYDADVLDDASRVALRDVHVVRRRHAGGLSDLTITRWYDVPECLHPSRESRSAATTELTLVTVVRLSPTGRLDIDVSCASAARDHRLQLAMPLGEGHAEHAVTFGQEMHRTQPTESADWVHPAPSTFCHQGWVARGGHLLLAPGLPEAELAGDSVLITLVRAVGWMSRPDLRTRPGRASPAIPVSEAQCPEGVSARIALLPDPVNPIARWSALEAFELAPVVVPAGDRPRVPENSAIVEVDDAVLSALKPADDGDGIVVRLWNPTDGESTVGLRLGNASLQLQECHLDETASQPTGLQHLDAGAPIQIDAAAHQLITLRGKDPHEDR